MTNEAAAEVLLKQQADRQRVVDLLVGRSKWYRFANWMPSAAMVAVVAVWSALTPGGNAQFPYVMMSALVVANLIGLSLAQGMTDRRLKALGMILERTGTLERFIAPDRVEAAVRAQAHP